MKHKIMKQAVILLAIAIGFAQSASAQTAVVDNPVSSIETTMPTSNGVDTSDKSDHYNNQSSIVSDTVPDKVSHTDQGQIKADRAAIDAKQKDLQAHEMHEQQQMQKDIQARQKDVSSTGSTPPIATQ